VPALFPPPPGALPQYTHPPATTPTPTTFSDHNFLLLCGGEGADLLRYCNKTTVEESGMRVKCPNGVRQV
jgi:hypothetical protein